MMYKLENVEKQHFSDHFTFFHFIAGKRQIKELLFPPIHPCPKIVEM
jgi:hypothetical protein